MIQEDVPPRILVVDDDPINVKVLVDLLRPTSALIVAKDGLQALERLKGDSLPDLALVDIMMPKMDGLELCRTMKNDPRLADVPVIFVSALGQSHDEAEGFASGAADYITKPISPVIALARVNTQLALHRAQRSLKRRNESLERVVQMRTQELALTQDVTIQALASLVEARDHETPGHILRTQRYLTSLAEGLRRDPRFAEALSDRSITLMFKAAPLHDLGKVGISDAILMKAGRLNAEEFEIMKTHTTLGRQALCAAAGESAKSSEFLRYAIEITGSHHEKWDGSGYPEGLRGEEIPLSARLMALADVYDALTSPRIYKLALSSSRAAGIIEANCAKHFDPAVIEAFLRQQAEFEDIARRYADPDPTGDARPAPGLRAAG